MAIFPKELMQPPKQFAQAASNLVHWVEYDRGGHFAAMEVPELLAQDMKTFFHDVAPQAAPKSGPTW